jgi:hypothetical protein
MAVPENPNVDRRFTYDSVNVYYKYKIAQFGTPSDPVLPTTVYNTPDELCVHLESVAKERGIPLERCASDTPYQWMNYIEKYPLTLQKEIWKYREYVYACSILFISSFIQKHVDTGDNSVVILTSHPRSIPYGFNINEHKFTIVGSSKLTSDIDITIQGSRSSFIISLLEDLYQYMSHAANIPIRCWDVEFYGDFKILQSVFVNMGKFNKSDRLTILVYALVSYFRSSHKHANKVNPIVLFLVNYCLTNFIESDRLPESFIHDAYNKYKSELPYGKLDRELFYRELMEVEFMSEMLKPDLKILDNGKIVSNNATISEKDADSVKTFGFGMFYNIMRGNVHRPESYIVPSTAVQVVEFEQKKSTFTNAIPDTWFSSNARIGIDSFGYIISAIEQLGYLEHYHPLNDKCNKKGIKYFGRLIRALVHAGLIPETSKLIGNSVQLNIYRGTEDASIQCAYDVHDLLYELQNTIKPIPLNRRAVNVTRRRRNSRRTRRYTK